MRNSPKLNYCLLVAILVAGCTARHYRKSADKEVYNIIQEKQKAALGQTNQFSIDTPYSQRKPEDIKAEEIIADRMREAKETLTLPDALRIALESSRQYQLRKEQLYLSGLTLTRERFVYVPQFFAGTQVTAERDPDGDPNINVASRAGFDRLFKTGGRIGLDLLTLEIEAACESHPAENIRRLERCEIEDAIFLPYPRGQHVGQAFQRIWFWC